MFFLNYFRSSAYNYPYSPCSVAVWQLFNKRIWRRRWWWWVFPAVGHRSSGTTHARVAVYIRPRLLTQLFMKSFPGCFLD